MGYSYSLSLTSFEVTDGPAFLADLADKVPGFECEFYVTADNKVYWDCHEAYQKWCCEEEEVIPVIQKWMTPESSCIMRWEGEDWDRGGSFITKGAVYELHYSEWVKRPTRRWMLRVITYILKGTPTMT